MSNPTSPALTEHRASTERVYLNMDGLRKATASSPFLAVENNSVDVVFE
ncbi:hypothetical protein EYZ11_005493 [Aspergillus tanneri]|uniref:Uncharacterized protein n=1 Tax=Aspergillus tanneri TaxID=1220188 RepID=A0A4S3JK65_9EURO|nr:hypothetical protein EYZ11_005493 [Aspergillus tanneri]